MTLDQLERVVINQSDSVPDWDALAESDRKLVSKIVLGQSPTNRDSSSLQLSDLPSDLSGMFPALTHLYLWQMDGLSQIPDLPKTLKCLEIRSCPDLTTVSSLPETLELLVLEDCPKLERLPDLSALVFNGLLDLSLRGCHGIPAGWINRLAERAPNLKSLDLTDCRQLSAIETWPSGQLERIEIGGCPDLEILPAEWPDSLRRLVIRGSDKVTLHEVPKSMDFLDLVGNQAMTKLPDLPATLRTLFLFGSRIQMPPASEHGNNDSQNVAEDTLEYFQDVEQFGRGEVKRCKLLMWGNGTAGKTCLSRCVVNDFQPIDEKPDSTHGVQFRDRKIRAFVDRQAKDVQVHIWDFGGQEIYHNTHRLFMSKGTVFTLLWNPDEDKSKEDWRPLRYWLDFIHLACAPDIPRIALVCSRRWKKTDELEQQWKSQVGQDYQDRLECFYINSFCESPKSKQPSGQTDDYHKWLKQNIGEVVATQGTVVPGYWEIAQNMVEEWLPSSMNRPQGDSQAKFNQLSFEEFHELLADRINAQFTKTEKSKYEKLAVAIENDEFELTERRCERVLRFLTHSGWLYWDRRLFERRVIIGQQWALDAIYALLKRDNDQENSIYDQLASKQGRFTRDDLSEFGWCHFKPHEQDLLLTYLLTTGLCFELVSEERSLYDKAVYVSFEHLPNLLTESRKTQLGEADNESAVATIESLLLHRFHWQRMLTELGRQFGSDGRYGRNGFYLQSNKQGQSILIQLGLNQEKIGGRLKLAVSGPDQDSLLDSLKSFVQSFLPETETGSRRSESRDGVQSPLGEKADLVKVFFSYAWDPVSKEIPAGLGYEEPVDAIDDLLDKNRDRVIPLRDKRMIEDGGDIVQFMEEATKSDLFIVFHSKKYWESQFCMFELVSMTHSLMNRSKRLSESALWIGLHDSGIHEQIDDYEDEWSTMTKFKHLMLRASKMDFDQLKAGVVDCLKNTIPEAFSLNNRHREWTRGETNTDVIEWIMQMVGLNEDDEC